MRSSRIINQYSSSLIFIVIHLSIESLELNFVNTVEFTVKFNDRIFLIKIFCWQQIKFPI